MFSPEEKTKIAETISTLLLSLNHREMPKSSPQFILHVDGAEIWSWANIVSNESRGKEVPVAIRENLSVQRD